MFIKRKMNLLPWLEILTYAFAKIAFVVALAVKRYKCKKLLNFTNCANSLQLEKCYIKFP